MKLSVFNQENYPKGTNRSGMPKISMSFKGMIAINPFAVELMGLQHGDKISFAQDEAEPGNWYLVKDKNGYEFRLHSDKKTLISCHSKLCTSLKESLGLDASVSYRFNVGGKPTIVDKAKYWGIINIPTN